MPSPPAIYSLLTLTAPGLRMEESTASPPRMDIHRLTAGLASGSETAFHEFHSAYFDRLLRYLIVVTRGDEEAARDALQETFLRVVRHARSFDQETVFWSWLTALARSAATDAGRKQQRYWRFLAGYAASWMTRLKGSGESEATEQHLHDLLECALDKLDSEDRALIEGKYLRRASVRELAAAFSLTEKAVESRLLRARRKLRQTLCQRLKDEESICQK